MDGLTYTLKVEGTEEVTFQLAVRNCDDQPRKLIFLTSQEFDFEVVHNGQPVWRWSQGRVFSQMIMEKTLAAEEVIGPYSTVWTGVNNKGIPNEPGNYEVRAYFLGNGSKEPVAATNFRFQK